MVNELPMINRVTRVGNLFDLYGGLLTERQREMMVLHYFDDWSLSEVAEHFGVSRQAVHDVLKRAEEQLESCDTALGLLDARETRRKALDAALDAWSTVSEHVPEDKRRTMQRLLDELALEYKF